MFCGRLEAQIASAKADTQVMETLASNQWTHPKADDVVALLFCRCAADAVAGAQQVCRRAGQVRLHDLHKDAESRFDSTGPSHLCGTVIVALPGKLNHLPGGSFSIDYTFFSAGQLPSICNRLTSDASTYLAAQADD